jgi:hypothetical protein
MRYSSSHETVPSRSKCPCRLYLKFPS